MSELQNQQLSHANNEKQPQSPSTTSPKTELLRSVGEVITTEAATRPSSLSLSPLYGSTKSPKIKNGNNSSQLPSNREINGNSTDETTSLLAAVRSPSLNEAELGTSGRSNTRRRSSSAGKKKDRSNSFRQKSSGTNNDAKSDSTPPSDHHSHNKQYVHNLFAVMLMVVGFVIGVTITLTATNEEIAARDRRTYDDYERSSLDMPRTATQHYIIVGKDKKNKEKAPAKDEEVYKTTVRTRPVCTYYYYDPHNYKYYQDTNENTPDPPRIIQTSMDNPSAPWTQQDCYPAEPVVLDYHHKPIKQKQPNHPHINAFHTPDAVLRVNFGQAPKGSSSIIGFGGAFTEAAALNYQHRLTDIGKQTVLELLFGETGLGYNIGRFPINSCDFSIESYSFDPVVDDFNLTYFDTNVTHDVPLQIQFALDAKAVYDAAWGNGPSDDDENNFIEEAVDALKDVLTWNDDDENYNLIIKNNKKNNGENNDDDTNTDDVDDEVFRFFASPWSPPNWMKIPTWEDEKLAAEAIATADDIDSEQTTDVQANGGIGIPQYAQKMTYSNVPNCLRDGVGPDSQYAAAWALYFSKFITAYKNHGIDMWAVTVQNEPEFPAPWEACSYSPQNESNFVANHLGPTLARDHPDVLIFGHDHNKDHVNEWVDTLLNSTRAEMEGYESAAQYVSGTAYHWYAGGMDRLLDGAVGIPNLHRLQSNLQKLAADVDVQQKQQHLVLGSEACHCPTTGYAGGDIHTYWARAERYAHTILADLAAGSNGWLEWNFLLDSIGGPNHVGNLCDASLLAVPHRATPSAVVDLNSAAATTEYEENIIPPLPDFEKTKPMSSDGKSITGDDRTREELNADGFLAKYLDVGIVVQPLYYYVGHISRYVRPGAYAVMGLVEQASGTNGRVFQAADSVVVGGGINDLARNGIEITLWPCEGSTRQQFIWDYNPASSDASSFTRHIQVLGHDWLGNPSKSCFPRGNDKDLLGITLTSCTDSLAGIFDVVPVDDDEYGRWYIQLLNPGTIVYGNDGQPEVIVNYGTKCLHILELANDGGAYGPRGGAQVVLGDCDDNESAKWKIDMNYGIASSFYFAPPDADDDDLADYEVCMTTGWPFLQMGAFMKGIPQSNQNNNKLFGDDNTDKTVIVLNEAREAANYVLKDNNDQIILTGSIPPRSIQTVLLD